MGNWRTDSIEVRFSAFDSIEDLFGGFGPNISEIVILIL